MSIERTPRRIRITSFHRSDACHGDPKYIGRTGMFTPNEFQATPGYFSGSIVYDGEFDGCTYFFAVRYRRI